MVSRPASWSPKLVVRDGVGQSVEPGRGYADGEVHEILHEWYAHDGVSRRRHLLEAAVPDRGVGSRSRIGGTFDR